jgi:hypothetical protein
MDYFLVKMKHCNTGIQSIPGLSELRKTRQREKKLYILGFRKIRKSREHNLHTYLPRRMYQFLHSF